MKNLDIKNIKNFELGRVHFYKSDKSNKEAHAIYKTMLQLSFKKNKV